MSKFSIIVALGVVAGLLWWRGSSSSARPSGGLPDHDPQLAARLVREEGAVLLDVRSEAEFGAGHVEGALHIPHTQVPARTDDVLRAAGGDKNKPIVVYCRAGRRAGIAKQELLRAGFTRVSNLGGMDQWIEPARP